MRISEKREEMDFLRQKKCFKRISLFMAVVFVVMSAVGGLSIQTGYAEDTTTTINAVVPEQISQGDTFDIDMKIANVTDLYGFSIGLYYDPNYLEVVSPDGVNGTTAVTAGNVFTGATMDNSKLINSFNINDDGTGEIEFANCLIGGGLGVNVGSDGASLGKVTFRALQDGDMQAVFDKDPYGTTKTMPVNSHVLVKLSDSNAAPITYQASDLNFTVEGYQVDGTVSVNMDNDTTDGIGVALYHYDEASGKYVMDGTVLDTTDETGTFSVMMPQSGDYQLGFYKPGYLLYIEPVTITDADVVLPAGIQLTRGDVNNDQAISFYDITNVISKYNISVNEAGYDANFDVNLNDTVDFYDITNIISVYNQTTHHDTAAEFMVVSIE